MLNCVTDVCSAEDARGVSVAVDGQFSNPGVSDEDWLASKGLVLSRLARLEKLVAEELVKDAKGGAEKSGGGERGDHLTGGSHAHCSSHAHCRCIVR